MKHLSVSLHIYQSDLVSDAEYNDSNMDFDDMRKKSLNIKNVYKKRVYNFYRSMTNWHPVIKHSEL